MFKNVLFYTFISVASLALLVSMYAIVTPNRDENIPRKSILQQQPVTDTFPFSTHLQSVAAANLIEQFPYDAYLRSRRYEDPTALRNDLISLDNRYPENIANLNNARAMYLAMTDTLFNRRKADYEQYNPDLYIQVIQWVESFKDMARYDPQREMLFGPVSDYWLQKISAPVSKHSEKSMGAKFDFKYRYIKTKLMEMGYTFSVKVSSIDKFVFNLTNKHWAHLIDATWNQTSILTKLLFFIVLFFGLTSCVYYTRYLINTFTSKNKK
jgi:hypothetical protein